MKADPTTWLINAPPRTRQAIAMALLLAIASAAIGTTLVAAGSLRQARLDVYEKRELLGRLQAIVALKPGLLEDDDRLSGDGSDFLKGESEAVVRGNLQAHLNAIFSAQNANLLSIGNIPDLDVEGARYIGIRADLFGTMEAIHRAIVAIETSQAVIIGEVSIWQSGARQGAEATQAQEVSAQIRIYGALDPAIQVSEAGTKP